MLSEENNTEILEISINNWVIDTTDITEFYFIEDLYSPCLIGYLHFIDRVGAVEGVPITGNELVTVKFGEDFDKMVFFHVFNFATAPLSQLGKSMDTAVEMFLVDTMFFPLTTQKYSRGWKQGTKISDIIKNIAQNMLYVDKFFIFEESIEKIDETRDGNISAFSMQNQTPMEAIRWLMKRCSGSDSKLPGYVFYNTAKGLCFVTLEKLFREAKTEKDKYGMKKIYKFVSGDETDDCKILSWELTKPDKQALVSLKGGHKMGFDFMSKTVIDHTYDYNSIIKNFTLLGGATLFPDISDDSVKYDYTGDDDEKIIRNIAIHEFIRRYILQLQLIITVRGNERRYPGILVDVLWESSDPDEILNRELNGLWMVKSITHYFKPDAPVKYQQKMTLITTAYKASKYKGYMKTEPGKKRMADQKGLSVGQ